LVATEAVGCSATQRAFTHRSYGAARRLWNDYLTGVDAIIYMIDAYDRERFPEAKAELEVFECLTLYLMAHMYQMAGTPLS